MGTPVAVVGFGRVHLVEPLQHALAAAGLGGLARLGAKAVDPRLGLFDESLLAFVGLALYLQPAGFLHHVAAVVAGVILDLAIVELGANDMMRGLEPKQARANLAQIVTVLQSKGVKVLLAAMVSSLNWGQAYKYEFDSIYPEIAEKQGATLVPFILEGVWGDPKMLVGDGVHPNEAGVAKMVGRLAPVVEKVLDSMAAQKAARPN